MTRNTPATYPLKKKALAKRANWKRRLIIAAVFIVIILIATLAAIPPIVINAMKLTAPVKFSSVYSSASFGLDAESIRLNTPDGLALEAWYAPVASPKAIVIFLSGIQNPSVTAYFPHAAWLQREGYASVLVEMRAHGGSDGDRIGLGITEVNDVRAAVSFIRSRNTPYIPIVAFGVSMGGATAINAFGEIPDIAGVISLSAYASFPDMFCQQMARTLGVPDSITQIEKPFVWLYLGVTYGFDKLHINPLAEIQKANGRPILLMQSLDDSQVSYSNFEMLSAAAPDADTFLRNGDYHFIISPDQFLNPEDDESYVESILEFLNANFGDV